VEANEFSREDRAAAIGVAGAGASFFFGKRRAIKVIYDRKREIARGLRQAQDNERLEKSR
jgi:hypothetical protein